MKEILLLLLGLLMFWLLGIAWEFELDNPEPVKQKLARSVKTGTGFYIAAVTGSIMPEDLSFTVYIYAFTIAFCILLYIKMSMQEAFSKALFTGLPICLLQWHLELIYDMVKISGYR